MENISGFKVSGVTYGIDAENAKYALSAETAESVNGMWVNTSGNLEINSEMAGAGKVNIVSSEAIQIKPGSTEMGKTEALQLDCEKGGVDCSEFSIKVCNGLQPKASRVSSLKLNISDLTIDNQNSSSLPSDLEEMSIKFRSDKKTKPIYAKMKARAFDFRCLDHGGIALQVAGEDAHGNENKVKFESARISPIGSANDYFVNSDGIVEGGKGLEFGTFNNLHTSLYSGDYRFKGDAKVYPSSRVIVWLDKNGNELEQIDENRALISKIDYRTQGDDFKDVTSEANSATWNDIVGVAKAWKNGSLSSGSGEGASTSNADHTWDDAVAQFADKNSVYSMTQVDDKLKPLSLMSSVISRKADNGNLEISAEALNKWEVVDGVNVDTEVPASLSIKAKEKVAIKSAALNLEGSSIVLPVEINKNGKVSVPGCAESGKNGNLGAISSVINASAPKFEINLVVDKNEFGSSDSDYAVKPISEGELFNSVEEYNEGKSSKKQLTQEQWEALPADDPKRYKVLPFSEEDAAAAQSNIDEVMAEYPVGKKLVSVNLFDLLSLVERVSTLESRISELQDAIDTEAALRKKRDDELQSSIDTETASRKTRDNELQDAIDAIGSNSQDQTNEPA